GCTAPRTRAPPRGTCRGAGRSGGRHRGSRVHYRKRTAHARSRPRPTHGSPRLRTAVCYSRRRVHTGAGAASDRRADAPVGAPRLVSVFTELDAEYEEVVFFHDPPTGLKAVIAIHSTTLGRALGGTRFYPFETEEDALRDVLRLSRAMTYT